MENIYRLKKRMVYPEKLTLDQTTRKTSALSTSSWCSEPLEDVRPNKIKDPNGLNESTSANTQFIQDRIRHLVDAFSYRTQSVRKKLEMPATPSSVSSHESIEFPAAPDPAPRTRHSSLEKDSENGTLPSPKNYRGKTNFFLSAKYYYDTEVIDPQDKSYLLWMSIAALAVLYNAWVIPLRSTFPYQNANNRAIWMFFDYFADVIYLIDMVLIQTRIMYLSEGFWISDYKSTRQNYMQKMQFKLDLLSLLPLDFLYLFLGPERVLLRLPRFFKLHTFWHFFQHVDKLLPSPYIIRTTRTLLYMMYLIHLNACAYYAFSEWEGIGSNNFVYNGRGNAYIVCFYFATKTATSIGKNPKPTQEIEFMFMTFSWLMGVFVFALLIGQIRDIIATATRSQSEYVKLVDETLEYMRRLNLPQDLQRRAQMWFNYTWETQHTLDENTIMDCLPHKMKTDIAINVHIKTLGKVNLFADCDEALLRELVLQLKSAIHLPGDIICKKGDVGQEMYIVQSGQVQVIGRTETEVLATLSEGSVFGEISLLGIPGMNRRTADVRSSGYSNLFVLSKDDLNDALQHYPEAQELLNKKAKLLIKKNASLEKKEEAVIVIENPIPATPHAKLLDTVMQVVPPDSKTNMFLRFGTKGEAREKLGSRNSLPILREYRTSDGTFQAKVTVHRSLS